MMRIFYAIVDGDPLTSGGYVVVPPHGDTVQDDEGKKRHLAYVGHNAWCAQCKTMGVIVGGSGISDDMRLFDHTLGGLKQAVSGDYVACGCGDHPRVLARYATSWRFIDNGTAVQAPVDNSEQQSSQWDEQFSLQDATTLRPLSGIRYRIHSSCGRTVEGTTDSEGKTARIVTSKAETLRLEIAGGNRHA